MADSVGPCSTLPGAVHKVPEGIMCDDHPDRPATHRVQGETDSFGAELHDMCSECYDEHKKALAEERETLQFCEGCNTEQKDVRPVRDPDEGMAGPLYYRCAACRKRMYDAFSAGDEDDHSSDCNPRYDDSYDDEEPEDYGPVQVQTQEECMGPEVEGPPEPPDDRPAGQPVAYVDGAYIFR